MADKYKKRYTAGEVLEAIFNDEDSLDEQFDYGSDVEIVPDSVESENGSDLDVQITQIISNLELQDQEAFDHANSSHFQALMLSGMFITANKHTLCICWFFLVNDSIKTMYYVSRTLCTKHVSFL